MPASSVAGVGWLALAQSVTAPPRPIRLLAHPYPIDVLALLPDHPPAQFIWQRRTHKIVKATGPERIAPPWWAAPAGTKSRDYFRVQDHHGARFWLYRDGLPERGEMAAWFLHGFFA
jgi:protein ImuB